MRLVRRASRNEPQIAPSTQPPATASPAGRLIRTRCDALEHSVSQECRRAENENTELEEQDCSRPWVAACLPRSPASLASQRLRQETQGTPRLITTLGPRTAPDKGNPDRLPRRCF